MGTGRASSRSESGQAAVEAALTLPLTVFLVLGTLQLFMMLQARIMAQYAVFCAVRAGTVQHGNCLPMQDAALAALLPTFTRVNSPADLGSAIQARRSNYAYTGDARDWNQTGAIFWLYRKVVNANGAEDKFFDQPTANGMPDHLSARLVFWYPLRIPFADWVMARMFLAYFGLGDYNAVNPLMVTQGNANWTTEQALTGNIGSELQSRILAGHYVAPIQVTYSMRLMTPARNGGNRTLANSNCPGAP